MHKGAAGRFWFLDGVSQELLSYRTVCVCVCVSETAILQDRGVLATVILQASLHLCHARLCILETSVIALVDSM